MQFGRIDGNAYTLDFQYPFSALQAFAVALANVTQRLKWMLDICVSFDTSKELVISTYHSLFFKWRVQFWMHIWVLFWFSNNN